MANIKRCPQCGEKLISIASNYQSCRNRNCKHFFNYKKYGKVYLFNDYPEQEKSFQSTNHGDYTEEYDDYLFFSNHPHYITRHDYRKNNDFLEETLFENNEKADFELFLKKNDIGNGKKKIEEKYQLIHKGRNLEYKDLKEAFDFYKHNNHF